MTDKALITKPIAAAVGTAFVASMAASTTAMAADNPFEATELDSGYMLADGHKGKDSGRRTIPPRARPVTPTYPAELLPIPHDSYL